MSHNSHVFVQTAACWPSALTTTLSTCTPSQSEGASTADTGSARWVCSLFHLLLFLVLDLFPVIVSLKRWRNKSVMQLLKTFWWFSQGHSSYITHLDWSPDNNNIMSNSGDYEILYCEYICYCSALYFKCCVITVLCFQGTFQADATWSGIVQSVKT